MLGLPDAGIAIVYALCVASALLCVVYGIVNWNKGSRDDEAKEKEWESHEQQIEENL